MIHAGPSSSKVPLENEGVLSLKKNHEQVHIPKKDKIEKAVD